MSAVYLIGILYRLNLSKSSKKYKMLYIFTAMSDNWVDIAEKQGFESVRMQVKRLAEYVDKTSDTVVFIQIEVGIYF